MKRIVCAALLCVPLGGCWQAVGIAASGLMQVREIYCEGTSDEGKAAIRAKLTQGQKLVACPAAPK